MVGGAMEKSQVFMGVMVALIIFLCVTLYLGITSEEQVLPGNWSVSIGNASARYSQGMYVDPEGTFYTIAGASIYAIDSDGVQKWTLPVKNDSSGNPSSLYLYTAERRDDTLYAVVGPDLDENGVVRSLLLAISGRGALLWKTPIPGYFSSQMSLSGGNLYIYHFPGTISVYNADGRLMWNRSHMTSWFTTGSDGMLYVINDSGPYDTNQQRPPSYVIEAYFPDGSIYWSSNFSDFYADTPLSPGSSGIDQLLYRDGIVYILKHDSLIAVNANGTLRWVKDYRQEEIMEAVGFDESGRLFLRSFGFSDDSEKSIVVAPDGEESIATLKGQHYHNYSLEGFSDGIGYYVTKYNPEENQDRLQNFTLKAYDMISGDMLWNYTIAPVHVRRTTLNDTNFADILYGWNDLEEIRSVNTVPQWVWYESKELPYGSHSVKGQFLTDMITSGSTIYFSYWAYSYEYPAFYDASDCTYAGGLYAIGGKGRLLWYKDTDSYITSMTAKNGTVYYQVNGGRFGATGANVTAGFAAAAVYLFFRFLVLGAVSRARSKLDKNVNRNTVLAFVAENPGASLYEITRALGMNVGTVRYHLLILSINHRISLAGNGRKSVGYFACSRLYSEEEKLLMPLMRREQIRELLNILSSQPGLSNAEIAAETGLAESAVSRYMIELNRRGVVAKKRSEKGKQAYCIDEKFYPAISDFLSGDIDYSGRQSVQEMPLAEASR